MTQTPNETERDTLPPPGLDERIEQLAVSVGEMVAFAIQHRDAATRVADSFSEVLQLVRSGERAREALELRVRRLEEHAGFNA